MLTEEKIKQAAEQYCRENNGSGFEFQAFLQGTEYAAKEVAEDLAGLVPAVKMQTKEIVSLTVENERLRETIQELRDEIVHLNNIIYEAQQ